MSKPKFYLGIRNEAASSTLELYFTDVIQNSWDWWTGDSTNMVQETINKVKDANPSKIHVVINSLGGDVQIGLGIYNFLKAHKAEVTTDNISFSASIASIIQQAADKGKRKMAKSGFMIIHAAWGLAIGNASEMKAQADVLDTITDQLAEIYALSSGKYDAQHFKNLWKNGDKWLTGDEAMELGLVDELYNGEPVMAQVDPQTFGFKNAPAGIYAALEPSNTTFLASLKNDFMKVMDSLKAAITGSKEDKKTDAIPNKAEILEMVESALKPFAEAVDKALEDLKPAEETTVEKSEAEKKAEADAAAKAAAEKAEADAKNNGEDPVAKLQADLKAQQEKFDKLLEALATKGSQPGNTSAEVPKTIGTATYEA